MCAPQRGCDGIWLFPGLWTRDNNNNSLWSTCEHILWNRRYINVYHYYYYLLLPHGVGIIPESCMLLNLGMHFCNCSFSNTVTRWRHAQCSIDVSDMECTSYHRYHHLVTMFVGARMDIWYGHWYLHWSCSVTSLGGLLFLLDKGVWVQWTGLDHWIFLLWRRFSCISLLFNWRATVQEIVCIAGTSWHWACLCCGSLTTSC